MKEKTLDYFPKVIKDGNYLSYQKSNVLFITKINEIGFFKKILGNDINVKNGSIPFGNINNQKVTFIKSFLLTGDSIKELGDEKEEYWTTEKGELAYFENGFLQASRRLNDNKIMKVNKTIIEYALAHNEGIEVQIFEKMVGYRLIGSQIICFEMLDNTNFLELECFLGKKEKPIMVLNTNDCETLIKGSSLLRIISKKGKISFIPLHSCYELDPVKKKIQKIVINRKEENEFTIEIPCEAIKNLKTEKITIHEVEKGYLLNNKLFVKKRKNFLFF